MAFHDVRLPDDVEKGATGGPTFHTTVIRLSSGGEQRNIDWSEARHEWDIGYGIQSIEDFAAVRAFFFARRGMAHSFRFKDWSDHEIDNELQGIGDGVNRVFQLIKPYEDDGPEPYYRRITRPVGSVVWRVNGVVAGASPGLLGQYTLTVAPADGAEVTASCDDFDMAVRFDVDKFALRLETFQAGEIQSLPVIEVRE